MDEIQQPPRKYHDLSDLERIHQLLIEGRRAANGTYYVHVGDLNWWLFYRYKEEALWDYLYVWDDPEHADRLLAWALLDPLWNTFDVFLQPCLKASLLAESIYAWAEAQAEQIARLQSKNAIRVFWIDQQDAYLIERLESRGFAYNAETVYLSCSLNAFLPAANPPAGFQLRSCDPATDAVERATASYGAFESSQPFDRYLERMVNFLHSPVFNDELNVVAAAADGRIASFCIGWVDPTNRVGLLEPVGTHPDFQRLGLGRTVMLETLHRLQERRMQQAMVVAENDNLPAIKLYESIGFQITSKLLEFQRKFRIGL